MFHATPKENLESILSEGIKPRCFAVYLSHQPDSWVRDGDGQVVLRVSTKGLTERFTVVKDAGDLDEVLYWGVIPPENIKVHRKKIGIRQKGYSYEK